MEKNPECVVGKEISELKRTISGKFKTNIP